MIDRLGRGRARVMAQQKRNDAMAAAATAKLHPPSSQVAAKTRQQRQRLQNSNSSNTKNPFVVYYIAVGLVLAASLLLGIHTTMILFQLALPLLILCSCHWVALRIYLRRWEEKRWKT